ncbi:hypothetical protein AVEN_117372-1 [Araneus ventricosus]|uniref:Uncharacterized protein n=1 Tax=Araneus ventricosus TaxID=182803 RepID=A0A4Y2E5P6_ARAVE|nr:hypothetical protein AVEN_117372-1 [Araneus ventricosus]
MVHNLFLDAPPIMTGEPIDRAAFSPTRKRESRKQRLEVRGRWRRGTMAQKAVAFLLYLRLCDFTVVNTVIIVTSRPILPDAAMLPQVLPFSHENGEA